MNALIKMAWVETKLFIREPMAAFFTLIFPLFVLVLFGGIYGNEPTEFFGGYGSVDISVPGYIGMIIGTIGLVGLPVSIASYREQGILRRLRATPVHPAIILGGQLLVQFGMAILGAIILIGAGRLLYNLQFPQMPLAVIPAIILASISFFAVSFVLAGLLKSPRAAQAAGMALFFPMLFLSGGSMPREILPESMQRIGEFLPLTHVVELIKDLWFGVGWNGTAVLILVSMFIAGLFISTRTFQWE